MPSTDEDDTVTEKDVRQIERQTAREVEREREDCAMARSADRDSELWLVETGIKGPIGSKNCVKFKLSIIQNVNKKSLTLLFEII